MTLSQIIKSIADTGTKVVIAQGSISEMALHFIEKYEMMALKIMSKWELRRLCTALRCTALVRLGPATPEEMGHAGNNIHCYKQHNLDNSTYVTLL
jgi:T-complex protein 1 subunit theta